MCLVCLRGVWEKYIEDKVENSVNKKLYKLWGIERIDLDKTPLITRWSEEEMVELGHS